VQTLENRSDGGGARQAFRQFVSDVSSLQIGKDQDVRTSRDGRSRRFRLGYRRNQRRISLKLAIDLQLRRTRFNRARGFNNFIDQTMLRAPFRREREESNTWLCSQ